jgi:hypothetical protein
MLGAERAPARSVTSIRLRSIALLGAVFIFDLLSSLLTPCEVGDEQRDAAYECYRSDA